jgi:hypothetical protein
MTPILHGKSQKRVNITHGVIGSDAESPAQPRRAIQELIRERTAGQGQMSPPRLKSRSCPPRLDARVQARQVRGFPAEM